MMTTTAEDKLSDMLRKEMLQIVNQPELYIDDCSLEAIRELFIGIIIGYGIGTSVFITEEDGCDINKVVDQFINKVDASYYTTLFDEEEKEKFYEHLMACLVGKGDREMRILKLYLRTRNTMHGVNDSTLINVMQRMEKIRNDDSEKS